MIGFTMGLPLIMGKQMMGYFFGDWIDVPSHLWRQGVKEKSWAYLKIGYPWVPLNPVVKEKMVPMKLAFWGNT